VGVGAAQAKRPRDPLQRVGVAVSHDPVTAHRRHQRERAFSVDLLDRPAESRVEVVDALTSCQRPIVRLGGTGNRRSPRAGGGVLAGSASSASA
jgi:hypothetical protein